MPRTKQADAKTAPQEDKPVYVKVIRDKAFAQRLNMACDNHPRAKPYFQGRLVWIKDEMQSQFEVVVALETVRKWFAGEARPRPSKMKQLAQLLEVDLAWLSLGVSPEAKPSERTARNVRAGGAVNVLAGFIQLAGGHPAFPDATDAKVHLYAIIDGSQFSLHAVLGEVDNKNNYRFVIPADAERLTVIGIAQYEQTAVDLIEMPFAMIKERGERKGDYYEVHIRETDGSYATGSKKWRIADLKNLSR